MRFAAVALATLALGACGDSDGPDSGAATSAELETEIVVVLDADGPGGAEPKRAQVSCPGSDPVCDAIAALPADAAAPIPPDTACTEIYGGPDTATISGTLEGDEVDIELTRVNGCEVERFDRFVPLLAELFAGYEPGSAIGA